MFPNNTNTRLVNDLEEPWYLLVAKGRVQSTLQSTHFLWFSWVYFCCFPVYWSTRDKPVLFCSWNSQSKALPRHEALFWEQVEHDQHRTSGHSGRNNTRTRNPGTDNSIPPRFPSMFSRTQFLRCGDLMFCKSSGSTTCRLRSNKRMFWSSGRVWTWILSTLCFLVTQRECGWLWSHSLLGKKWPQLGRVGIFTGHNNGSFLLPVNFEQLPGTITEFCRSQLKL